MFFEELFKVLLFQKWATLQLPALRLYDGHFSMNFHFHQIQFGFQDTKVIDYLSSLLKPKRISCCVSC